MSGRAAPNPIDRIILSSARVYASALEHHTETPSDDTARALEAARTRYLLAAQQLMPQRALERLAGMQTVRVMR